MISSTEELSREEDLKPTGAALYPQEEFEDPLSYLPFSTIMEYQRNSTIYTYDQPSMHLYLVMAGRVKVSRLSDNGHQTVVEIYRTDDFFGESALLTLSKHQEQATAIGPVKVMTWAAPSVKELILRRPRLGTALLQVLIRRNTTLKERIQSFSADTIARRLARSLMGFAERLGTPEKDGIVWMPAMTHELLSQYVGTSREIVTYYMNQFRREGYVYYTRTSITLRAGALRQWLTKNK
jgi:CRP/FNR family transcriptional regulator